MTRIDEIAQQWREAKAAEEAARQARLEAEKLLLECMGKLADEGKQHQDTTWFRVTVTTRINRKVDSEILEKIQDQIPLPIRANVLRYKPELDLKEMRYLQNNEPALYAILAQAITATPAKPSISVEVL